MRSRLVLFVDNKFLLRFALLLMALSVVLRQWLQMHFGKFVEFWIGIVGLIELSLFPHSVDKLFKEREMLFS